MRPLGAGVGACTYGEYYTKKGIGLVLNCSLKEIRARFEAHRRSRLQAQVRFLQREGKEVSKEINDVTTSENKENVEIQGPAGTEKADEKPEGVEKAEKFVEEIAKGWTTVPTRSRAASEMSLRGGSSSLSGTERWETGEG